MASDAPPPAAWPVASDWRERAERIGARLRGREDAIRGVGVGGDYAAGIAWEASLLRVVVFPHAEQARLDQGGIAYDSEVPYVVDRITTGLLTELEALLGQEPLAGMLAGLAPLRLADATLRDLLPAFRDRYHSAEGRAERIRRALQAAKVALDDCGAGGPPVLAVEALQDGLGRAAAAALGDPPDRLRLPRRLRAGGRVLRVEGAGEEVGAALGLAERDAEDVWKAVDQLEGLARAHLEARAPEVGAALTPLIERALEPGRRASAALAERGDGAGAVWAALSAAAELDGLIERAAPGWRERDDYARRAASVYGEPDVERLQGLRRRFGGRIG